MRIALTGGSDGGVDIANLRFVKAPDVSIALLEAPGVAQTLAVGGG